MKTIFRRTYFLGKIKTMFYYQRRVIFSLSVVLLFSTGCSPVYKTNVWDATIFVLIDYQHNVKFTLPQGFRPVTAEDRKEDLILKHLNKEYIFIPHGGEIFFYYFIHPQKKIIINAVIFNWDDLISEDDVRKIKEQLNFQNSAKKEKLLQSWREKWKAPNLHAQYSEVNQFPWITIQTNNLFNLFSILSMKVDPIRDPPRQKRLAIVFTYSHIKNEKESAQALTQFLDQLDLDPFTEKERIVK